MELMTKHPNNEPIIEAEQSRQARLTRARIIYYETLIEASKVYELTATNAKKAFYAAINCSEDKVEN